MPSIYDFKPRFQQWLRPIIGTLVGAGVKPNHVTLAAMAGSALVGLDFWRHADHPHWLWLPLWLFVRMALNAIDGMMAREHNLKSRLGAVLNELGDVLSDIVLYLPIAGVWFVLGAALTEFCGVLAQALGGTRRYDGPMGKSDRAFLVGALALATFIIPPVRKLFPFVFGLATVLEIVTCRNRLREAA